MLTNFSPYIRVYFAHLLIALFGGKEALWASKSEEETLKRIQHAKYNIFKRRLEYSVE